MYVAHFAVGQQRERERMSFSPRPSHARSRETHAKHTLIEGFHPPSPMLLYMPLGMMYIYTTERGEGWYREEEEETKKLDLGEKKGNKSLDAVRGEKFLKMSLSRVSTYTYSHYKYDTTTKCFYVVGKYHCLGK